MTREHAGPPGTGAAEGGAWLAVLIAAWLGATTLFAAVVAPALFAVLPSRALAGLVVGRTLPVLFIAGIVVGTAVFAVALARRPAARLRLACAAGGACMVLACSAAQFVVGTRIHRVRAAIGGSLDALEPGDPLRAEFGRLHGVSVGLLGLAALGGVVALAACGLRATRSSGGRP